ncbi:MAG: C1 family peptidase [Tatlockia sp.]|nr:C1 family peptidase [Tatlockia sp.]
MTLKIIIPKFAQVLILSLLVFKPALAEDVKVVGTLVHPLKQNNIHSIKNTEKQIQLLQLELSNDEKNYLALQAKNVQNHKDPFLETSPTIENSPLPTSAQLGMNKVPVLDQGSHGTCVTFAVTGALDAIIGKGDYFSQLCNLQLGKYLEIHGQGYSGWNGSYPMNVISQISQYGLMNMTNQRKSGCGGLTEYPTHNLLTGQSMEPEQFSLNSELVFGKSANWSEAFHNRQPVINLNEVKQAIHAGDRLTFAVMLPRIDLGTIGTLGKYKTWFYYDTWLLTPEIIEGLRTVKAGHEMIITGYDDNALATDNLGKKHKGLLKLRNSWGTSVGDYGEFYMSYDFFKLLSYDLKRFSSN